MCNVYEFYSVKELIFNYINCIGMSTNSDCKVMLNYQNAPMRLELRRTFDPRVQLTELQPGCKLPTNFSGHWFYPSEYQTSVSYLFTNKL